MELDAIEKEEALLQHNAKAKAGTAGVEAGVVHIDKVIERLAQVRETD